MTKQEYTTRTGNKQYKPVLSVKGYQKAENEYKGFCLSCGNVQTNCEPDARQYVCERCKLPKVYGIPELLVMGLAVIK